MVVLRFCGVGLLLIPLQVEAMTPWNSTDMINKRSADRNTQADYALQLHDAQAKSSFADAMLSENQTILSISEQRLAERSAGRKGWGSGEADK